ncbi:SSI family serine proteinase inhibitor [Streptomyces sp. NPDC048172]|uniref:SSI family serine proteinase inhibitor n=1 Tax=Streptomyces sp. NPDC048172 TaxID=3365505 RepID=UPI0037247786
MRTFTKRAAAGAAAVVSCLAVTAGTASAAPAAPRAASAGTSTLVLAVGQSGFTGTMVPARVVTLECGAYAPGGDHPDAARACDDLNRVDGAFSSLVGLSRNEACTREFSPVKVTVDGYWKGRHVNFSHTFENACVKRLNASYLFQF